MLDPPVLSFSSFENSKQLIGIKVKSQEMSIGYAYGISGRKYIFVTFQCLASYESSIIEIEVTRHYTMIFLIYELNFNRNIHLYNAMIFYLS